VAEVGLFGGESTLVGVGGGDQSAQHGGAYVDGVDVDPGVGAEQRSGEAAIAVTEDQSVLA